MACERGSATHLVDLHLKEADGDTELELVHELLPDDADTEELARHWEAALDRIDAEAL